MSLLHTTIDDLPVFENVIIVINVNTWISTTLAILSAKKTTDYPVVVIDCSNNDDDIKILQKLSYEFDFYLIKMPLQRHGLTLDLLFRKINAKYICLLDSDAEIIDFSFFRNELIHDENTFGIGFINGPFPLDEKSWPHGGGSGLIYYQERMYIPCVLLKREKIIEALDAGCSFKDKWEFNDFPIRSIARLLYRRFRFKLFLKNDIPFLKYFRKTYYDYHKPSMVIYDTGAQVYMFLKYKCGYDFIGLPERFHNRYFNHFFGMTRKILNPDDGNTTSLNSVETLIATRLNDIYNFDVAKIKREYFL